MNGASSSALPALLYLSISDGLDSRTNKEIATLSRSFTVDYLGVSATGQKPFFTGQARRIELIPGRTRSIKTLLRLAGRTIVLLCRNRYASVHVVNEDLYLLFLPLLLGQRVVLDVFDSSFLKWRMPNWVIGMGRRISYTLPAKIIVTDDERAGLMPAYVQHKLVVIPNYPFQYNGPFEKREPGIVRVYYTGSLSARRGTDFIRQLLDAAEDVRVVMTGWIRDETTRQLSTHPRVEWLGLVTQEQSITLATRCDFILCHYEPKNTNNIYASPNKIYDAIQAGCAVIINPEVRVSRFVREQGLGVVLDAFEPADMKQVAQALRDFAKSYRPNPALRAEYLWEKVEPLLLAAHGINSPGTN